MRTGMVAHAHACAWAPTATQWWESTQPPCSKRQFLPRKIAACYPLGYQELRPGQAQPRPPEDQT